MTPHPHPMKKGKQKKERQQKRGKKKKKSKNKEGDTEEKEGKTEEKKEEDTRQVCSIRYLPEREVVDRNTAQLVTIPGVFKGMIKTGTMDRKEFVTLEQEWVERNIHEEFRQLLMTLSTKGKGGFVEIPEGRNEPDKGRGLVYPPNAPPATYWDANDKRRRCAFLCTASGLHFLGLTNLAELVANLVVPLDYLAKPLQFIASKIQENKTREHHKMFQIIKLKGQRKKNWDMLTSPNDYRMCVVGVKSDDGKTDHAICVAKGWIFDSNFEKALPLTRKSLDLCCSSNTTPTAFKEAMRGFMLSMGQNSKMQV